MEEKSPSFIQNLNKYLLRIKQILFVLKIVYLLKRFLKRKETCIFLFKLISNLTRNPNSFIFCKNQTLCICHHYPKDDTMEVLWSLNKSGPPPGDFWKYKVHYRAFFDYQKKYNKCPKFISYRRAKTDKRYKKDILSFYSRLESGISLKYKILYFN